MLSRNGSEAVWVFYKVIFPTFWRTPDLDRTSETERRTEAKVRGFLFPKEGKLRRQHPCHVATALWFQCSNGRQNPIRSPLERLTRQNKLSFGNTFPPADRLAILLSSTPLSSAPMPGVIQHVWDHMVIQYPHE